MPFTAADLVTVGLLVALEGLLSADNAIVLAVMVLSLPREQHQKALQYGLIGAFAFRVVTTLMAAYFIELTIVKLIGAAYLLYLPYKHFTEQHAGGQHSMAPARGWLGLSPFWATVVKVELTNLVFSVDSILVAVAMSPKLWVVLAGGILGIVMMRVVIGQLLTLVQRYPPLVDGAFMIIAWVGLKLLLEYAHDMDWIHFAVPRWLSLGLIAVIFLGAFLYARAKGPVAVQTDSTQARDLLEHKVPSD